MVTAKASFLDLPPELRLKVYRNLFILENLQLFYYVQRLPHTWPAKRDASHTAAACPVANFENRNAASPQFLMTCKLCLEEGLPVLYGENELCFDNPSVLRYFLDLWSMEAKGSIRTIIFEGSLFKKAGLSAVARYLNALTSIRKFEFQPLPFSGCGNHMSLNGEGRKSLSQKMNDAYFPGKTFLGALFDRNPSVICGIVQGVITLYRVSR